MLDEFHIVICEGLSNHDAADQRMTLDEARAEAERISKLGHAATICRITPVETVPAAKER